MWEYQVGEQRIRFWLEWDRATMGTRDLMAKFMTYAQYMASREWFRERAVLPLLHVVAPGLYYNDRTIGRSRTACRNLVQSASERPSGGNDTETSVFRYIKSIVANIDAQVDEVESEHSQNRRESDI